MAAEPPIESSPEFWLVVLLRAMRASNLQAAAEAQTHLAELGIEIRFGRLLDAGHTRQPEASQ